MKLLLLVVLALLGAYMVSGYLAARRHRVPFGRVLSEQWRRVRRVLVPLVWAAMLVPLAWSVVSAGSTDGVAEHLRSWWLLYVACVVFLWLLRAWPFSGVGGGSG